MPFIKTLFPNEDLNTYYKPAYRNDNQDSVSASGKFYGCYRKLRNLFLRAGLLNDKDVSDIDTTGTVS